MAFKVLITGGSGFLGINLIRYLLERDCEIINIDFAPFTYPDCRERIVHIDGDIRDRSSIDKAMAGVRMVVHCAAALPLYSQKDIFTTDVYGTCNVLQSALDNKIERIIHISSTAVYGVPDHHPIYENDPMVGVGPYGEAKILAEKVSLDFRKRGLCVPIIRPKSFIGPERLGIFALLYDWANTGHNFPILGKGYNRYQLLDVEDLCEAIWSCMVLPAEKVNDVFNIGSKIFSTLKNDFQAVLDSAGYGKHIISIPAEPAIFLLKAFEMFGLSPLYKWIYDTAAKESFVSIEKAEEFLSYRPRFSNKDALLRNFKWYIEDLDEINRASGISHRVPWKQGILQLGKILF